MPLDSDSVRALAHAGLNRLAAIHEIAVAAPAMPAKVSMTPHTVPNNPMNGPPATAVESTIIPFSNDMAWLAAASSSVTLTASKEEGLIRF